MKFKVLLVAQGFSQRPGVNSDQTSTPVLDMTSSKYLLALAVYFFLEIFLLDVGIVYLYWNLDMPPTSPPLLISFLNFLLPRPKSSLA